MVNQIKVPAYLGLEKGYELGSPLNIPNGDINCEIKFYITSHALEHWSKKNLKSFEQATDVALTKFSEQNLKKFQRLLLIVLGKLIQHYKGFPSPIHLTEKLWFCFDKGYYPASCKNWSGDFKIIRICFNVDYLKESKSWITKTIKHELLHRISELHEGQDNTIRIISKWQDKLKEVIHENIIIVDKGVNELLDYYSKNLSKPKLTPERIEEIIKFFYKFSTKRFWNTISDSALCVIAIELDDMKFIAACIKRDKLGFYALETILKNIDLTMVHIIKNEPDERRRNFLLAALKLLQFMTCFSCMPFEAIAYGILGDGWRPRMKKHFARNLWKSWHKNKAAKNIDNFKKIVRETCSSEVASRFLRFYDSYLDIIKAQAIHNDPLNPNITQQIHNTECLRRGKKAYVILNNEFGKLFKELKKYE